MCKIDSLMFLTAISVSLDFCRCLFALLLIGKDTYVQIYLPVWNAFKINVVEEEFEDTKRVLS
jgi:hypothetical protein